jgi:Immunoglobulin domain
VCYGGGAIFSVLAAGTAPFNYVWRTNGIPVPGATNSTFRLSNPGTTDTLKGFDVAVNDAFGSVTSRVARITFSTNAVAITTPPTSQVIMPGISNVTFGVAVTGDAPLNFQWRTNGVAIAGATNSSYWLTNPTPAGQATPFDVVVVNPCGSVTSSPPVFALFPHAFYAAQDAGPGLFAGEILNLIDVNSLPLNVWSSPALDQPITNWNLEGPMTEVPLNDGSGNSQYSLNVVPAASPVYYIVGTSVAWPYLMPIPVVWLTTSDYINFSVWGTDMVADTSGLLSLPVPPGIAQSPTSQNVWLGTNAQFAVAATGSEPLYYQWWFDTAPIPDAVRSTFALINVSATNSGDYFVVVTSDYGSATSSIATLGVITPFYAAYDAGQGLFAGEILNLTNKSGMTINAWSSPALDQPLSNWNAEGSLFEVPLDDGSGNSIYSLNVAPSASPTYYVAGISVSGPYPPDVPVLALLTIDYANFTVTNSDLAVGLGGLLAPPSPPVITQQPTSLSVMAGNHAGFVALATGNAPLNFQWYINTNFATGGGTNSNLDIPNATATQAGKYFVVVTNPFGSVTSQVATLAVAPPPLLRASAVVSGFQLTGTGIPGSLFYVEAAANLNPPIAWQVLATNLVGSDGAIQFVDVSIGSAPQKVYRLGFPSLFQMPPVIIRQPGNKIVLAGTAPSLSVTASSQATLSFQWFTSSNSILPGATNSIFSPGPVNPEQSSSNYQVVVANLWGSVTSNVAVVRVLPTPQLRIQPASNGFRIAAQAIPGDPYLLQANSDLRPPIVWATVCTNVADTLGAVQFQITNLHNFPFRVYRLATP